MVTSPARRRAATLLVLLALLCESTPAQVFLNEVLANPPTAAADDVREYIELLGTPGRKLDGFAIAIVNGTEDKLYPLGSIPPVPVPAPEIDELFSLDGLSLGSNGILVIGIGPASNYTTLLPDTSFARWTTLWSGPFDVPGKLENDGSGTIMLLRNRPGATEADPLHPLGPVWVKDGDPDIDFAVVFDPDSGMFMDQYGDGSLDRGGVSGLGVNKLDTRGSTTPADRSDDLEIVDEVSYEHGSGWEYDQDDRNVDVGGASLPFKERNVHALDDPSGFDPPDAMSRVDHRTKGAGWPPGPGTTGELPGGNNWQDTATEQWVRGELETGLTGQGFAPFYYYTTTALTDPEDIAEAPQPFETHVPLWLDDGAMPDFDFVTADTYQLMPGRLNPFAVPFIPGDADRDGDVDADDIAKIARVFGRDDWIFNPEFVPQDKTPVAAAPHAGGAGPKPKAGSIGTHVAPIAEAPSGDSMDPADQVRPWDVDGTGDNGIECSDLQWALDFQGDTTGQIVGRTYTSAVPASSGVVLNSNAGTTVTVTRAAFVPSGHALSALEIGDTFTLTVSAQLTAGANMTPGAENGVMQFAHDVLVAAGGIVRVADVDAQGAFATTRAAIQAPQGNDGDLGVRLVNGHATSSTQGLGSASALYAVTFEAIGLGSTTVSVAAAASPKFAASTPRGVKLGHTLSHGDPAAASYPAALTVGVTIPSTASADCGPDAGRGGPGIASLAVCGERATGAPLDVHLEGVPPGAWTLWVVGPALGSDTAGGRPIVTPAPWLATALLRADDRGALHLPGVVPAPGSAPLFLQVLYAAEPWGVSNTVRLAPAP